jgi:hypothetical protein
VAAIVVAGAIGLLAGAGVAAGQASLSAIDTAYTQDFNTLASTGQSDVVPLGWAFSELGTNANTTYTAGTGSNNAGDTYSFGSTDDRGGVHQQHRRDHLVARRRLRR